MVFLKDSVGRNFSVLWIEIEVVTTTYYVSDSYHVRIPLQGQPAGFNLQYLMTQPMLTIDIYIGFPSNPDAFNTGDLTHVMTGDIDEMSIDPFNQVVSFSGRDLTSRFIDTKTYEKYANQTASNIAGQLAKKHGLGAVIQPTSGNVGTYYNNANTLMTKQTTEWDLLTFLAQQVGYVTYVALNDLIFAPQASVQQVEPFIIQYQPQTQSYGSPISNTKTLTFSRCFTLTKDVTVYIRVPYSPLTGRAFTAKAGKKNPTINSTSAGNQIYTLTLAGLTPQQAQQKAQSLLSQITLNEIKMEATLPFPEGSILTKASPIQVIGTQSRLDQVYYSDTIIRRIAYGEGYTVEINAKNFDVNSQVVL